MKREDYISWDEYFMGVAKLAAMRSKDPNTQVGSCIVSRILLPVARLGLIRVKVERFTHQFRKITARIFHK